VWADSPMALFDGGIGLSGPLVVDGSATVRNNLTVDDDIYNSNLRIYKDIPGNSYIVNQVGAELSIISNTAGSNYGSLLLRGGNYLRLQSDSGAVRIYQSSFWVDGTSLFGDTVTVNALLDVNGNADISGTLDVSGNTTLGNASADAHTVNGTLTTNPGVQAYEIGNRGKALYFQSQTNDFVSFLDLFSKRGDGGDDVGLNLWGYGNIDSIDDRHRMVHRYDASSDDYRSYIEHGGTQTAKEYRLYTNDHTEQLVLDTAGSVSMSGALRANLDSITILANTYVQGDESIAFLNDANTATNFTIDNDFYFDTSFACTLTVNIGSVTWDSVDTIGTCRIVKVGASYTVDIYDMNASVSATTGAIVMVKPALPSGIAATHDFEVPLLSADGTIPIVMDYEATFRILDISLYSGSLLGFKGRSFTYTR